VSETIQVGRYLCHRKIGSGGMAEIFGARLDGVHSFTKEVAIKLMHRHLSSNPTIVDLFVNEARITGDLDHPNIVTVFELGKHNGQLFMVMELVDGLDLGALLTRLTENGRIMDWDAALIIAMEVARALQFVHACVVGRQGLADPVVHRDLSPGNIMVSRAGGVKLLDFGVAKTLVGDDDTDTIARGKWHYMSPEQVRGEQLDGRSDLFSLGTVLFELLTGRQAFKGQSVVDSMRNVEQADLPPAPDLEPVLEELLTKLLARDRDARYANASEALEAMAQILMLRGKTTGDLQIATLLHTLDTTTRSALVTKESGPVLAAVDSAYLGVGDQSEIRTIPQRNPDARKNAGADETEPGETTLPTVLGSHRTERKQSGVPPLTVAPLMDDESTSVTDDQLTNPRGTRRPRHEQPDAPPRAAAEERNLPDPSLPQVYFDHFMPDDEVQEVTVKPQVWAGRNMVVLILAILAILTAGVAILIAIGQRRGRPPGRTTTGHPPPSPPPNAPPTPASRRRSPMPQRGGPQETPRRLSHEPGPMIPSTPTPRAPCP
jgi:eukaryotic-like serine/threonine-protein kinase